MPKENKWFKRLVIIFLLSVFWEMFIFVRLPKQAFIQGLLESWFVSKGLIFYKDFGGQYLPLLRLLMVPLHTLFGYNQFTTIALAPLNSVLILFVLFWASSKWLKGWVKLVPIVFFTIWHTILSNNHFVATSFLGLVVLVSVVLWVSWWDNQNKLKSFLIGLATAFGIYTLQIVLPFYAIFNLSMLFKNRKQIIFSTAGFLFPTFVIILIFLSRGALVDLYNLTIRYHFTNYPYEYLGKGLEDILVFLSIHSPLILALVVGLKEKTKLWHAVALLMLPTTFWFAIFHPLRFEISLPSVSLIYAIAIQSLISFKASNLRKIGFWILGITLLLNGFVLLKYKFSNYWELLFIREYKYEILSEVYKDDPMYDAVEWIKANSLPSDKIFVLADALFYVKADRLPANKRAVASEPFVYTPFEDFEAEIKKSWPAFWVIDERQWARMDDFGYKDLRLKFQKLVEHDPIVYQIEYFTIRKHLK